MSDEPARPAIPEFEARLSRAEADLAQARAEQARDEAWRLAGGDGSASGPPPGVDLGARGHPPTKLRDELARLSPEEIVGRHRRGELDSILRDEA